MIAKGIEVAEFKQFYAVHESRIKQAEQLLINGAHVRPEVLIEIAILLAIEFKNDTPKAAFDAITLNLLKEVKL